jgi:hypothetical protein
VVDNRSAGFYGIGGAFNFKSGDASGTAAKMSQDKYGSEAMYLPPAEAEEDSYGRDNYYVDRSALLRATLNSLAMSNVASVINSKRFKKKMSMYKNNEDEDTEVTPESLEEVFEDSEE